MKYFLFVCITLLIFSCSKEELTPIVEEETVEEVSPFTRLLGTWKVDFAVSNEDTTFYGTETDILHIEENRSFTDSLAVGYFLRANNPIRSTITLELPNLEGDSIIIRERNLIFNCNYYLHDDNHLEIDDSLSETQIWKTHYVR